MKIKDSRNIITFTKVSGKHGWLGNMWTCGVKHDGLVWPSTEHLFQALRFPKGSSIREDIRKAEKAIDAKHISTANEEQRIVNRGSEEDVENMRLCLRLKLKDHPQLRDRLLETGDKFIIEDVSGRNNPNDPWGMRKQYGFWEGENLLGNLWMELRKELQSELATQKQFFDF